jgi:hypothetical protein
MKRTEMIEMYATRWDFVKHSNQKKCIRWTFSKNDWQSIYHYQSRNAEELSIVKPKNDFNSKNDQ